jgi:hypothetical protein
MSYPVKEGRRVGVWTPSSQGRLGMYQMGVCCPLYTTRVSEFGSSSPTLQTSVPTCADLCTDLCRPLYRLLPTSVPTFANLCTGFLPTSVPTFADLYQFCRPLYRPFADLCTDLQAHSTGSHCMFLPTKGANSWTCDSSTATFCGPGLGFWPCTSTCAPRGAPSTAPPPGKPPSPSCRRLCPARRKIAVPPSSCPSLWRSFPSLPGAFDTGHPCLGDHPGRSLRDALRHGE